MFQAPRKRRRRFDSRSSRREATQGQRFRTRRLGLESLEPRQMLSAAPLQLVSHAAGSISSGDRASFMAPQQTAVSQDGRYVAFVSDATNLVSGETLSGAYDVYRYDRLTGNIDLVSANTAGTGGGNSDSGDPVISADGSVVAFLSTANNLSALDTSGSTQEVFARDFRTNTTSLVSVSFTGTGSGDATSYRPAISANGRVVAFVSDASNLSPLLDTVTGQFHRQVFARNLTTGTTSLVSVNFAGTGTGNGWSGDGSIYYSGISNVGGGGSGNQPAPSSILDGTAPAISADGSAIAFASASGNLISAGITGVDIYARNLNTSITTLVSSWVPNPSFGSYPGITFGGNGDSSNPVISANGNVVAYQSFANGPTDFGLPASQFSSIFTFDLTTGTRNQLANGGGNARNAVLSADGSVVAYQSSAGGTNNVYAWSADTGTTSLLSVNIAGTGGGNADSGFPQISADGTIVVFDSYASDLAPLDTNRTFDQYGDMFGDDVFARSLGNGTTTLLSMNAAGTASGNGNSSNAVISADGSTVAFTSDASNLVSGDGNGFPDVFLAQPHIPVPVLPQDITIADPGNLKISYDSTTKRIIVQDLDGDPLFSTIGRGSGTSTLSLSPSKFTGNIILNGSAANHNLTVDGSFEGSGRGIVFNSGLGNSRLTVNEPTAGSATSIAFNGGPGTNYLSVVGAGGTATITPTTSGAGSVLIDGSTTVSFTGLGGGADISGMGTATVASPASSQTNALSLFAGFDNATSAIPAILVNGGIALFNNTNLNIDTSAITGTGHGIIGVGQVSAGIGLGHGNTNITLKTNANGWVTFSADLLATGTVVIDTPTAFLRIPLSLAGKSTTAATTTLNVTAQGSIQNAIDLARTGATINVDGGTYSGPLHLSKSVALHLSQNVTITLPLGATNADIQSTIAVLQGSTAAGPPQLVIPVAGANLATAITSLPALNPSGTPVQIGLLVSGTAVNYTVGNKLLTVAFVNGPTLSQQVDELIPGARKLVVTGTSGNDTVTFKQTDDVVKVEIVGFSTGSFLPTGRVVAYCQGGNDVIDASKLKLSAWLHGGSGNDILIGGAGDDMLQGGGGNNQLYGGGGRDLLIGGTGSNQIFGNGGQDILIAGTTTFDGNDAALMAILNEWDSDRTYAQRVANLMGTGTGASFTARLNGNAFLNANAARGAITVMGDGNRDTLNGGGGRDLYFANLVLEPGDQSTTTDQIIGLQKNEVAVDIDFVPPPDNGGV